MSYTFSLLLITYLFILINTKDTKDINFINKYKVKHIQEGDGKIFPTKGSLITLHYTGVYTETGKVFDSSRNKVPFDFSIGKSQVILCWEKVVARMSKNERIKVVCPYGVQYGIQYGVEGEEVIEKKNLTLNSDYSFDIEVLDIRNIK